MNCTRKIFWVVVFVILLGLVVAAVFVGSGQIGGRQVWDALLGRDVPEGVRTVVVDFRLLKALTAVVAGAAVSVSGLLMQTLFRNPLAGPYVLGISSGASLGAALFLLGTSSAGVLASLGLAGAAWIGAGAVLALVIGLSRKIKDIMVILILGMMLGTGISAVVQVLQYLGDETALKGYVVWTMGSLAYVTWGQFAIFAGAVGLGMLLAFISVKQLNLLLLGESYALTMGMDADRTRRVIFVVTVLLAGSVTAFCGPLGFVGLAVPHLTRMVTRSANHRVLVPGTVLLGAAVMLGCDMVAGWLALPVNAVTSLVGIPVVVYIVLRYRG